MAYVIKICLVALLFTVPSGTSVEHMRMSIINAGETNSSELQTAVESEIALLISFRAASEMSPVV
jgi:hypothetical protein